MRVLHVIAGAKVGGAETYAQDAIIALHEIGVAQHVICRPHPIALERYAKHEISVSINKFSPIGRAFFGGREVSKQVKLFQPDVVHAWMSRAASFIPNQIACPVIGWFGGYYDLKNYKTSDGYVGVTREIQKHILLNGVPPHRSFVVNTFGTLPQDDGVSRAQFSTPDHAKVLLVLSRMHWKKGIDLIVKAMLELPDCYLWLAGDGPDMEKYLKLVRDLGLENRVRFLGWRTDRKSLLDACDICVLPSRYEPFGTVIVEAWAAKKPLVAANAAGARQYVRHGQDGFVFEIDDLEGLVNCIKFACNFPIEVSAVVETAFNKYRAYFSKEISTLNLLSAYQKILKLGKQNKDSVIYLTDVNNGLVESLYKIFTRYLDVKKYKHLKAAIFVFFSYISDVSDRNNESYDVAVDVAVLQLSGLVDFIQNTDGRRRVVLIAPSDVDRLLDDLNFDPYGPDYESIWRAFMSYTEDELGLQYARSQKRTAEMTPAVQASMSRHA